MFYNLNNFRKYCSANKILLQHTYYAGDADLIRVDMIYNRQAVSPWLTSESIPERGSACYLALSNHQLQKTNGEHLTPKSSNEDRLLTELLITLNNKKVQAFAVRMDDHSTRKILFDAKQFIFDHKPKMENMEF